MFSSCITNKDLDILRSKENISLKPFNYNYMFMPGDLLSVQINTNSETQLDYFNKEQHSNSQLLVQNPYLYGYLIDDDGDINLPTLGKVRVKGFTKSEIEKILSTIANDYFDSPVVRVNIINFTVNIFGEVNNPGLKRISKTNPDILHCVALASGFTQVADKKKIKIIRNNSNRKEIFTVDLSDASLLKTKDFFTLPNDVIYVPPMKKRFYAFSNIPQFISVGISAFTLFLLINDN